MNLIFSLLLTFAMTSPALFAGGGKSKSKKQKVTIEGEFSSKRGVMHRLSCFCFDGGYITTESGDEIAVCFEKGELETAASKSEKFVCDHITVTGVYVEKTISPDVSSPCTAGTMRYLKVMSFTCR
jgi:hypothetical protein